MVTLLSVAGVIAAGSTAALVNAQVLDTQTARPPAVSIAGEVDLGDDATLGTATRLDPATDPVPAGSTTTPSATTIAITPITGVALDPSPSARLTEAAPPPVPPPLVADDGDDDGDDDDDGDGDDDGDDEGASITSATSANAPRPTSGDSSSGSPVPGTHDEPDEPDVADDFEAHDAPDDGWSNPHAPGSGYRSDDDD